MADGRGTELFVERDDELDAGHALIGPIEVRGARAGQTLEIAIDELRVGAGGVTEAGGFSTPLNERLGVADGETFTLLGHSMRMPASAARTPGGRSRCARFSAS